MSTAEYQRRWLDSPTGMWLDRCMNTTPLPAVGQKVTVSVATTKRPNGGAERRSVLVTRVEGDTFFGMVKTSGLRYEYGPLTVERIIG